MTATVSRHDQPSIQSAKLGGFILLLCLVLAVAAALTAAPIVQRQLDDTQNMLSQVFPSDLYDNRISNEEYRLVINGQPVHFFLGRKQGQPLSLIHI